MSDKNPHIDCAHTWAEKCNEFAQHGKIDKAKMERAMFKYGGEFIAPIVREGLRIGNRFQFQDDSFMDMYFSTPDKVFFGTRKNTLKGISNANLPKLQALQ